MIHPWRTGQGANGAGARLGHRPSQRPVVVPGGNTTEARVKVEAADNIFFDVSDTDFGIAASTGCTYTVLPTSTWVGAPLVFMGAAGVLINVILLVLNMIPLPPLDGGRVLVGLLPAKLARVVSQVEPYGLFILIALLVTGVLGRIVLPFVIGAIVLLPGSNVVLSLFFS